MCSTSALCINCCIQPARERLCRQVYRVGSGQSPSQCINAQIYCAYNAAPPHIHWRRGFALYCFSFRRYLLLGGVHYPIFMLYVYVASHSFNSLHRTLLYTLQSNTYQAVVVTDGSSTYTVFTYLCNDLDNTTLGGRIGYYNDSCNFVEHEFSLAQMSFMVACANEEETPWSNIVYHLTPS